MPPSQTLEKPYESVNPKNKKKGGDSFKLKIRRIAANLHGYKNNFDSDIKIIRSKEGWRFKGRLLAELVSEYEEAKSAQENA